MAISRWILSFNCTYNLPAGVRHIVVMLSIGDLLLAVSHIWGISQNVEKFLEVYHPNQSDISATDVQCTTQAVVAVFGTMASFLWTLSLAFFVCSTNCIPGMQLNYRPPSSSTTFLNIMYMPLPTYSKCSAMS